MFALPRGRLLWGFKGTFYDQFAALVKDLSGLILNVERAGLISDVFGPN